MHNVSVSHYTFAGVKASDYECNGFAVHVVAGGSFFVVFDSDGYIAGTLLRPMRSSGEYHWTAVDRDNRLVTDKAITAKEALTALVDWSSYVEDYAA
jgi:hypothetical protein